MKLTFRLLLSFFVLAAATITATAQNIECAAKIADAPMILNLKLGATTAEARAVFGKDLKIKNKTKGEYTFFQNYIDKTPPALLANVRALYLRFFDGALYQIEIFYQNRDLLPSREDFINSEAARLNVPVSAWKIKNGVRRLPCADFSVTTDDVLNPRVELTDETIRAQIAARREKKKN